MEPREIVRTLTKEIARHPELVAKIGALDAKEKEALAKECSDFVLARAAALRAARRRTK